MSNMDMAIYSEDDVRSKLILDQVPEGVILLNLQYKVTYFNKHALAFQHLCRKPLQHYALFTDIVSESRANIVEFYLQQVKETKKVQSSEAEYHDANGNSFHFDVSFSPILNDKDEIDFICVNFHEITVQKIFEKKATKLFQDQINLIDTANAVIFSIDARGYITEWNQECERITNNSKNDVLTKKITLFAEGKNAFQQFIDRLVTECRPANFELKLLTVKDETVTVLVNATPRLNDAGVAIGVLFVGQDITELSTYRTSLEQKVRESTQELKKAMGKEKELVELKNQFVSIASHEFRTPLAAIASCAENLKTGDPQGEATTKSLESIEKHVRYMQSLIDDLLTMGKFESTKLKGNNKPVNLTDFLGKIADEVLSGVKHSHQIKWALPDDQVIIDSDEKLLRNIFINLISNAVKFSPEKSAVDISLEFSPDFIVVTVKDYGIGIPDDYLETVFQPFSRAANTGNIRGTGLGLSIVKKAVDALDGEINIKSSPGNGTEIRISLRNTNQV